MMTLDKFYATADDAYDSPWKQAIENYFPEFMAFYFPSAHAEIDWTQGYLSLDQELAQVVRDATLDRRYVDKLLQIWLVGGTEGWVYIHIEIQGSHDGEFAKRMFTYNYRLFDRYDRPIASLAILTDDSHNWRPQYFGYKLFGCQHFMHFPVVKLLDYQNNLDALFEDQNPFALVTAAHLLTRQTRGDVNGRYAAKWRLARLLYERDWEKQRIIELFSIIDWMMRLPQDLNQELWSEIQNLEKNKSMCYVTSVERIGIEQGIVTGRKHEATALVLRLLRRRLGILADDLADKIETLSLTDIENLSEAMLDFMGIADLTTWLEQHSRGTH